jgi:hypothetical protein
VNNTEWGQMTDEELEMALDLAGVEVVEPLPQTDLVRQLKAIGELNGINVEEL